MAFHTIILVCLLAAAASSTIGAAPTTSEADDFYRMIVALSEKVDVSDFNAYRSGLIKDKNEFAIRVAKAFNDQAYRVTGLSPCSDNVTLTGRAITCGLAIPVVGENVVSVQLDFTETSVAVSLVVASKKIELQSYDLETFFDYGITLSFSDALLNQFPGLLSLAKHFLIAELKMTAKHQPDGTGHICIAYAVGVRGPLGFSIPGFPYPSDVDLMCADVQMTLPNPPGFFRRIIIRATLLGGWAKSQVGGFFTTIGEIVG